MIQASMSRIAQSLGDKLRDSEQDFIELSREEADKILALPSRAARQRAYDSLRVAWARDGDRLMPEDEARVLASLRGTDEKGFPIPGPPEVQFPLTLSVLMSTISKWRTTLVASALRRAGELGQEVSASSLEQLVRAPATEGTDAGLPELAQIRILESVQRELQEGLEEQRIFAGEVIVGSLLNPLGLLKTVSGMRARRDLLVPPIPPTPQLRSAITEIMVWLEGLIAFEEAVGGRALLHAGVSLEPAEAMARFGSAARRGDTDIEGHAGRQIASWRCADRAHRALTAALAVGWLTKERVVTLPSFEADEIERWFLAFTLFPDLPAEIPVPAPPLAVHDYWARRRARALRHISLSLLASGAVREPAAAEQHALQLISGGFSGFASEFAEVRAAEAILQLCDQAQRWGVALEPVAEPTNADRVISIWSQGLISHGDSRNRAEEAAKAQATAGGPTPPVSIPAPAQSAALPVPQASAEAEADAMPPADPAEAPAPTAAAPASVSPSAPAAPQLSARLATSVQQPPRPIAAARRAEPARPTISEGGEKSRTPNLQAQEWLGLGEARGPDPFQPLRLGEEELQASPPRRRERFRDKVRALWRSRLEMSPRLRRVLALATVCVVYQAVSIGVMVASGEVSTVHDAAVLRSAAITDIYWLTSGVLLSAAFLLLLTLRRTTVGFFGKLIRCVTAVVLAFVAYAAPSENAVISTGSGLPVWPEQIEDRGGVPTSVLNPAQGFWMAGRAVRPMQVDDLPIAGNGRPRLVLLREVGMFGIGGQWFLADSPEVERIAKRQVSKFPSAPPITTRRPASSTPEQ